MDDRKFIEGRLSFPLKSVNHIVVGSSRVMQINSEIIGEPILNLAVSGASIEDDIAISLEAVAKLNAKNVYGKSKIINELTADIWNNILKIPIIGLRFFTVYGEWGRPDMFIIKLLNSYSKKRTFHLNFEHVLQ